MTTKKGFLAGLFCGALLCAGVLSAQKPVENIDPNKHANLAAAQRFIVQAYDKAVEAQKENKDQLGDHAEKAKQHLVEADQELKAAAEYADHRK